MYVCVSMSSRSNIGKDVELCEIVFCSLVCTYIIRTYKICIYVCTFAYVCCVLTALDLDMAQLPIHREILQVHGTRCCNC